MTTAADIGSNVVAAVDSQSTSIYTTDAAPGQWPEHIVAVDQHGTCEAGSSAYWREVTEALSRAGAILVLGHGTGEASAACYWIAYVDRYRKDVAAKVIGEVRVDLDRLDDEQVLRLAQYYFAGIPVSIRRRAPWPIATR